ncbi:MAG: hypothetical protein OXQ84_01800 [bacterium]|nr:hypothetical protein [bacterium]
MTDKVRHLHTVPPVAQPGANGGGDDFDTRLRALEIQMGRMDERVAGMQENMATKNDITNLKVWILGGVLSGIILAALIAVTVVKAFL